MKKKYRKIPFEISIHIRYLHQDKGDKSADVCKRYLNYSKTSIFRHSKLPLGEPKKDGRHSNCGRPQKLQQRDKRILVKCLLKLRKEDGNCSSVDVQQEVGLHSVSNRTIIRTLKKEGYGYTQCRRKGILLQKDLQKRLNFARRCKKSAWILIERGNFILFRWHQLGA